MYACACLPVCRYFTFGFVRDPVSRLESAYTTILNRARGSSCENYEHFAGSPADAAQLCTDMYHSPDGFAKFVSFLADHGAGFDEHIRPQVSFFDALGGKRRSAASDGFIRPDLLADIRDIGECCCSFRALPFEKNNLTCRSFQARASPVHAVGVVWPLISQKLGFDPPLLEVPRMRQREGGHIVVKNQINTTFTEDMIHLAESIYANDYCCFFPGRLEDGMEVRECRIDASGQQEPADGALW